MSEYKSSNSLKELSDLKNNDLDKEFKELHTKKVSEYTLSEIDQEKYEEARDYYEKHFELFPGMCFCVVCLVIK
jgi:hypothetical protein